MAITEAVVYMKQMSALAVRKKHTSQKHTLKVGRQNGF